MRRRLIIWGCLALACVLLSQAAQAREVTVILKDGTSVKGDMVGQNDSSVTLMIANISRRISRDNIDEIRVEQTPTELFNQRKAELEKDDVAGRYRLAQWAYENGHHQLALTELQALSREFPDHSYGRRISLLTRVVSNAIQREAEAQREREESASSSARNGDGAAVPDAGENQVVEVEPVDATPPRKNPRDRGKRWVVERDQLLTDEQINLIKVYEIDLDERPTVVVPPDTIDELFKNYSDEVIPRGRREQAEFRGMRGYRQLAVLFRVRAKELYGDVIVRDDPPAMLTFKRQIHRQYVLAQCGECHGNGGAEGLFLTLDRPTSNPTVYSNFYSLTRVENARGRMLDRQRPEDSLLIQYGLPADEAKAPHPDVEGWRPAFYGDYTRSQQYRALVEWIGEELFNPAPNYGINWQPPVRPGADEEGDLDPADRIIDVGGGE